MATAPTLPPNRAAWLEGPQARVVLRAIIITAQLATIVLTWPLWQVRTSPPLLPLGPLPQVNMGAALVVTSLLMLGLPRAGLLLHALALGWAMALDQTRIQPQMISFVLLAMGTLPGQDGLLIARTHLIALWGFAGLHKLLSHGYFADVAPWLCEGVLPELAPNTLYGLALASALFEFGLGIGALWPRVRWAVVAAAVALHGGVLLALSPCGHNWNTSVWPWNAALMAAAVFLIGPWRTNMVTDFRAAHWPVRAAVLVLAISPLGYYVGAVDAYFAHCLYSGNTPKATRYDAEGWPANLDTWDALNVPLPPEPRLFEQYFRAVAAPGERLEIHDSRPFMRWRGRGEVEIEIPREPVDDEAPPAYTPLL